MGLPRPTSVFMARCRPHRLLPARQKNKDNSQQKLMTETAKTIAQSCRKSSMTGKQGSITTENDDENGRSRRRHVSMMDACIEASVHCNTGASNRPTYHKSSSCTHSVISFVQAGIQVVKRLSLRFSSTVFKETRGDYQIDKPRNPKLL